MGQRLVYCIIKSFLTSDKVRVFKFIQTARVKRTRYEYILNIGEVKG